MVSGFQIKKINVLRRHIGMENDDYKAMLSGFERMDGTPADSVHQLSTEDGMVLISILERLIQNIPKATTRFATETQIQRLMEVWKNLPQTDNEDPKKQLRAYLKHNYQITSIKKIPSENLPEITYNLNRMKKSAIN